MYASHLELQKEYTRIREQQADLKRQQQNIHLKSELTKKQAQELEQFRKTLEAQRMENEKANISLGHQTKQLEAEKDALSLERNKIDGATCLKVGKTVPYKAEPIIARTKEDNI